MEILFKLNEAMLWDTNVNLRQSFDSDIIRKVMMMQIITFNSFSPSTGSLKNLSRISNVKRTMIILKAVIPLQTIFVKSKLILLLNNISFS